MVTTNENPDRKKHFIKMPYPISHERYKDASLSKCTDLTNEQAERLERWLANPKNFLIIHSTFGVGKTYLGAAIANRRYEKNIHTYYFNENEMFSRLAEMQREGQDPAIYLQGLCKNNNFMIWDDLGSTLTHGKNNFYDDDRKNIMYQFIDERYNSKQPTIITTNYKIHELDSMINPRISSRLLAKENLIIELVGEDKRSLGQ